MYAGDPIDVPAIVSVAPSAGARGRNGFRDSEVGDGGAAAREQHVVRLDVAMHNAVTVRELERARHVAQDPRLPADGERTARQPRAQRFTLDIRHREPRQPVGITGRRTAPRAGAAAWRRA
jgi:hypothetical protein